MLFLFLLALQPGLKQDHQIDVATAKDILEREVHLRQEMIRLLQEIEERKKEATLLSTLQQQWPFWTTAVALALLTMVWWQTRQRKPQESPQSFRAYCSDLPPDVSEVEIRLILGDPNDSRS
ncbi:hypothetical protein BTVI_44799 [Pitangus sulphuratus]|nr:hypothetical protein BTVI_44799 [Pitangus sulphuratus]